MQVVVKMPPIEEMKITGDIPYWLITLLSQKYGSNLSIEKDDDDEYIDVNKCKWYQEAKKRMTPGNSMMIYRENFGWTQEELGKKLGGVPRQNISSMEKGSRGISKAMAKKLSKLFHVPVERFI